MGKFDGKTAVVTGASRGIGRAIAKKLAACGATVIINYNGSESKAAAVQQEIIDEGGRADIFQCNVSDFAACEAFFKAVTEKYGRIDFLINNAGISMRALFEDVELDVLRRLMDVNFWGTAYCSKYALPHLQGTQGSLVAVSSVAGYKGLPGRTGYSASKFAIQGLMEVIRIENLHNNVHVLIACPGFTRSNIRNVALTADGSQQGESPLDENKLMSAEKVAHKIACAVYHRKNNIILTAQGKATVYLNKFVPQFLNNMGFRHFVHEPNSPLK